MDDRNKVRVVSHLGDQDTTVSVGQLPGAMKCLRDHGTRIIEISARLGGPYDNAGRRTEPTCPTDPNCKVTLITDLKKGRVTAAANSGMIPPECYECAGQRVMIAVGLIPELKRGIPSAAPQDS